MKSKELIAVSIKTGLLFGLIFACSVIWFIAYASLDFELLKKVNTKDWRPEQLAVIGRAENVMIIGSVAASLLSVAVLKVIGLIKRSREMKNE